MIRRKLRGPTVPDAVGPTDALNLIDGYKIALPDHIVDVIKRAAPPHPDDEAFKGNEVHVIASAARLIDVRHPCFNRQSTAEISVPA